LKKAQFTPPLLVRRSLQQRRKALSDAKSIRLGAENPLPEAKATKQAVE
jgi:hypothetical protein